MKDAYTPEPEKRERAGFRSNPGMSQLTTKAFTKPAVRVMAGLNRAKIGIEGEQEYVRPDEFRKDGKPKTYTVDIVVKDSRFKKVGIEIEGKGSASKNNERRDWFLTGSGKGPQLFDLLHYPNSVKVKEIISDLERSYRA